MAKMIWVTWETQRRNRSLSGALGAKLFEFDLRMAAWRRYLVAAHRTIKVILVERPQVIFVQNPSLVLAWLGVSIGRVLGIPTVVDAHNAGLYPFDGKRGWANRMARHVLRGATVTLVTTAPLRQYVERSGGAAFVLPDPIPELDTRRSRDLRLRGRVNVMFICTYAADEPFVEVMKAARLVGSDVTIYMTGRPSKEAVRLRDTLPENLVMTGYLSEEEYTQLLCAVDVVIDLTTRDNCLVCGAYESLAAGKPMILSNTAALREYFSAGAMYTDNTTEDLAVKIGMAIAAREKLSAEVRTLRQKRAGEWEQRRQRFMRLLGEGDSRRAIRMRFREAAEEPA